MNLILLILGVILLVVAIVDALWTTLWVDGHAGPVSRRLTTVIWRGTRALVANKRHRLKSLNGPVTLATTVVLWVLMILAGWTLVLGGSPTSLQASTGTTAIGWIDRIYFVAYAMFTMGNGDFQPNGSLWQIVTALITGTGMIFVTLAISYVISVLSAVVQKRSFASQVSSLGMRGEDVVVEAWTGQDFAGLDGTLTPLANQLTTLTEQHLAYPILYYYHAAEERRGSAVGVTILHDTLLLLSFGVAPECRPSPVVLQAARAAVNNHLDSLRAAFIEAAEETPPPPKLAPLREAGIPTVSDEEFTRALDEDRERRRKLEGMIQKGAWKSYHVLKERRA